MDLKSIGITVAIVIATIAILAMVKTGAEKKSLLDTLTSK